MFNDFEVMDRAAMVANNIENNIGSPIAVQTDSRFKKAYGVGAASTIPGTGSTSGRRGESRGVPNLVKKWLRALWGRLIKIKMPGMVECGTEGVSSQWRLDIHKCRLPEDVPVAHRFLRLSSSL